MQSGWLPGGASGQSPGKAALFSSPQGHRLTKEKDWCWYQRCHFTDLCFWGCQLLLCENEDETMFYCAFDKTGMSRRKEGYVQILHNISHSSVALSISWLFRGCKAARLWWLWKVNPWKTAGAPPQAYSRLPPAVSAAALLSACSCRGQHSIPEAWD